MKKKRLLVFSDCYIYGGSERLMSFLIKNEVLNESYDLIYAYRKHKEYEEGLKNEGLLNRKGNFPLILLSNETFFYKVNAKISNQALRLIIKIPFFIIEKIGLYFLWNIFVFMKLLLTTKPDIIHVNNGGYPAAKSCNILVVANFLTIRSKVIYQVNNQARKRKIFFEKFYDAFVHKNVSRFINASNNAKQQLVVNRNFDPNKILVINNCVPLPEIRINKTDICEELNIPKDSFLIVEVAFLSERKGQRYLIDALYKLFENGSISKNKVYCAFIGNGIDEGLLRNHISELDLSSNVFLLGYRKNSEDFISACDLFLLPSIKDEDMPLVILSALGYGKAIVATDFAGISQVIENGVNGILLKNDLETFTTSIAYEIKHLYDDEVLRKKMGDNARKVYKDYSPKSYGMKLKETYEKVLAN
ncbi:glycosyltransferase [Pedobacter sp. UBA4863]|uniref:glycosyltransferase n=1 Tax=Pedobacter sp. UBA4863 TaxID=1947060 RepID=UPI0025EC6183|nr:glycosyltransferase [Pedobacter sp. UBA4863]